MARLDVRVQTKLDTRVIYISRDEKVEENVTIQELSLSGALVFGLSSQLKEIFTIRPTLPGYGEVELLAKIIRPSKGGMAIRIFYSDKNTMQALWDHIRGNLILGDSCPYCGYADASREGTCKKCDLYLNFSKDIYLERHVENTFAQRLSIRLNRLNLEHFQKIIQFVDSKLLKVQHRSPDKEFVGTSPGMLAVFAMIRKVAPTEMSVLLLGESGTGKELTVKALHTMSARKDGPLVAVNCAAIPESLLEAELFGYEKGAFTGAYAAKKGKFESADGGTLFLDEIGDLPSHASGQTAAVSRRQTHRKGRLFSFEKDRRENRCRHQQRPATVNGGGEIQVGSLLPAEFIYHQTPPFERPGRRQGPPGQAFSGEIRPQ